MHIINFKKCAIFVNHILCSPPGANDYCRCTAIQARGGIAPGRVGHWIEPRSGSMGAWRPMRKQLERSVRQALLATLVLGLSVSGQHEQSLDAFVPAAHKTVFESHNLLVLGDLNLAKSSVEGSLGVSGRAQVEEFEINKGRRCNKYMPAVTVGGAFLASMGSVNNGFAIVGRGSKISHNVRMSCTSRVESYDPLKQKIRSFEEHRESLIKESGDVCVNPVSGDVQLDSENGVMRLIPGNSTYSCYSVFKTSVDALASVRRLELAASSSERNVLIIVTGKSATFRDFAMVNFNPERTLLTFCAVYGHIEVFNGRLHGSIFAPTTEFTFMSSVVNGSMISGGLRGKVALLNRPYYTC